MDRWRFRIVENGDVMSCLPRRIVGAPYLLEAHFGWAHFFSSNVKHVPKISSTHFTPQQTPNLQSPLKTSCPPPKFNVRPLFKIDDSFLVHFGLFSRARNLFYFQRVNLQQAEAPPFRFTGPQTSCTKVETKKCVKK